MKLFLRFHFWNVIDKLVHATFYIPLPGHRQGLVWTNRPCNKVEEAYDERLLK